MRHIALSHNPAPPNGRLGCWHGRRTLKCAGAVDRGSRAGNGSQRGDQQPARSSTRLCVRSNANLCKALAISRVTLTAVNARVDIAPEEATPELEPAAGYCGDQRAIDLLQRILATKFANQPGLLRRPRAGSIPPAAREVSGGCLKNLS